MDLTQFFLLLFPFLSFESKLLVCILNKNFNKAFFPHLPISIETTFKFLKDKRSFKKVINYPLPNIIDILLEVPINVIINLIKKNENFQINLFTTNKVIKGDIISVFLRRHELFQAILSKLKGESKKRFEKHFWKLGGNHIPSTIHTSNQFFYSLVKNIEIDKIECLNDYELSVFNFMKTKEQNILQKFPEIFKQEFLSFEFLKLVIKYILYFDKLSDLQYYHITSLRLPLDFIEDLENTFVKWTIKTNRYRIRDISEKHFHYLCYSKHKKTFLKLIKLNFIHFETSIVICHRRRLNDIVKAIIKSYILFSFNHDKIENMFKYAWFTSKETFEYLVKSFPYTSSAFCNCLYKDPSGDIVRNSLFESIVCDNSVPQHRREDLLRNVIKMTSIDISKNTLKKIIIDIITLGSGCRSGVLIQQSYTLKIILCDEEYKNIFKKYCQSKLASDYNSDYDGLLRIFSFN